MIESVGRACQRAAATERLRMRRRLTSLAVIASTAPFVGLFGAVLGIEKCRGFYMGEKTSLMAGIALRLSWALIPFLLSLFVALQARWSYHLFSKAALRLEHEMEAAGLALTNALARI